MDFKKQIKFKVMAGAVLLVMFLSIATPVLFYPKQAQAVPVEDWPKFIWDKVWEYLKKAWAEGAGVAYRNAINSYTSTIATQTAEWVAGGGKGQSPLFISSPDYWTAMGDDMLGEFIDSAARATGFFTQSLCDPIDPTLRLNILISFDPVYQKKVWKQETHCSFSKIKQRISEAQQKNLIEFSIDFKEGPVGRYKSSFRDILEADSVLKQWPDKSEGNKEWIGGKNRVDALKNIAQNIVEVQDEFSKTVEALQTDNKDSLMTLPTQEGFQKLINKIVWGTPDNENDLAYLKYWQKNTSVCAAKKQQDFCSNQECLAIGNVSPTDCSYFECKGLTANLKDKDCEEKDRQYVGYVNALAYTQRANLYVKQLVVWTTTLEDMIKKTNFTAITAKEQATLEDIGRMFSEDNDLRVTLELQSNLMNKQTTAITNSKYFQSLQGRMNDVTTKISGLTKTPSTLVSEATRQVVEKGEASPMQYTGVAAADAIGIFTSTLTSKLLNQIFEKGFNWNYAPWAPRSEPFLNVNGGVTTLSTGGESFFADLTVASLKKGGEISIYDEYSVCPQDPKYALPSNCVMDSGIVRALEENLTLKQAMDKNLIHPDWLISGRSKKDAATDYLNRYSLTNIKKLRAIRVFPLGLEIAAQKIYDGELGDAQFTLKDIVDGFDKVSSDLDCNTTKKVATGSTWQKASPFCHLVDPNWVLKAPSFQCETIAYSAIPLPGSSQRQETCVDMKDCIHEDANGKCDTWGYCTREKNIWRAGGNSCNGQFNTCQTYKRTSDNKSYSYLADTLNFANCNASDIGCKWYCADYGKGLATGGKDIWACKSPGVSYEKDNDGKYVTTDNSKNAIFFNRNVEKCDASTEGCHEYIRTALDLGTNLAPNGGFESGILKDNGADGWDPYWKGYSLIDADKLSGSKAIKVSLGCTCAQTPCDACKSGAGQGVNIIVQPDEYVTASVWSKVNSYTSGSFKIYMQGTDGKGEWHDPLFDCSLPTTNKNQWQRTVCTYHNTDPTGQAKVTRIYLITTDYSGEILLDNTQFEIGKTPSPYKDYGSNNKIYLKTAPIWMGCNTNPDNPECDNFAKKCSSADVGCGLYTPINNDPIIPGIVSEKNRCSEKCVGANYFKEMKTNFETEQPDVLLIPSLATSCSAPGCEEFTNLDEVVKGGEGIQYYSYIRKCQKPSDACGYYYTWVGSDTNGYQLKKYYLKSEDDGPEKVNSALEGANCNGPEDLTDPHCKEFYDADGKVSYRIYENTITCSDSCSSLRKTPSVNFTADKCTASRGTWENGNCIYQAIPNESISCNKANVGCREYKGSAANNIKQVLKSDFEDGNQGWIGGRPSNESVNKDGYSMEIISEVKAIEYAASGLVTQGKSYIISFWAKGRGTWRADFSAAGKDSLLIGSTLSPDENWREIKLGPVYFDREVGSDEKLIISTAYRNYYIDNIILKEVKDDLNLIKNSWVTKMTPLNCTVPGCQAYKDQNNKLQYLASFARLCNEKSVGCEALIDTQNSASPFAETFKSGITVSADSPIYLINDSKKSCQETNKGCQRFGLPTLSATDTVTGWSDLYLKNNPDNYSTKILCDSANTGCEEYNISGSGSSVYFKDPGENLCEYREKVSLSGGDNITGWFTKGTDQPCYYNTNKTPYLLNGIYGIKTSTETGYEKAGLCPQNQTGCTQFTESVGTLTNMVTNGSFEEGKTYWLNDCPPGQGYQETCNGVILNPIDDYVDGKKGLQISANGSDWVGLVSQDIKIDPKPYPRYFYLFGNIKIPGTLKGSWQLHFQALTANENGKCGESGNSDIAHCHTTINGNYQFNNSHTKNEWFSAWRYEKVDSNVTNLRIFVIADDTQGNNDKVNVDNLQIIEFTPQPYYYLDDGKLDQSSCQGNVSQKQGCILLLDNSQGSATYNTFATYKKSEATNPKYELVSPVNCAKEGSEDYTKYCLPNGQTTNDANIILKVRQDRTCGEWLTCTSSRSEWDTNSGSYKDICEAVGRCDKLIGSGNTNQCGHLIWEQNPAVLTENIYQDRDVSWSGMDYAGHSIYNMYPIERLTAKEYVDANNNLGYRLSYVNALGDVYGVNGIKLKSSIQPDSIISSTDLAKLTIAKTCRAYPEKDSPFKGNNANGGAPYYSDVNVCSDATNGAGDQKDCQCSYTKAVYGGTTKYYNSESLAGDSICIGSNGSETSDTTKESCEGKSSAATGNTWTLLTKKTNAIGLRGFCLEPDPSKPTDVNACITWWPGQPTGDPDIYNQFLSAGYQAANDREWYCTKKIIPSAKSNPITNAKDVTASGSCAQWGEGLAYKCYDINDGDNPTCPSCTDTWTYEETFNYYKNDIASIDFNLKSDSDWCGLGHRSGWDANTTIKANNPNWKASWKKGADYVDITVLFDESNKLTGFNLSSCDGSADDGGFGVAGITINFNTGCGQVVKIANEEDQNMTKAFTNRVNNIKNYYNDPIDSKIYTTMDANNKTDSQCQPWGALGSWDQSAYITSASGCGDNMVDSSSIYSSITPLQKLFTTSYSIYNYIFPGVCQRKCQDGLNQNNNCLTDENCGEKTSVISHDCIGICSGANHSCKTDDDCFMAGTCGNGICEDGPKKDNTCQLSSQDCSEPATYYTCGNLTCSTTGSCVGKNVGDICEIHPGLDYTYQRTNTSLNSPSDIKSPQIVSVNCTEKGQCQNGNLDKITIGDVDNEDITRSQSYLAVLKFYAWADKDQMPIRNITIDWGDVIQPNPYLVMAKNHKPVCCADNLTCDNFGDTPNACTNNYFQFNHIYSCASGGSGWNKFGCSNACCFQPKVSITDNWGKTTNVSFQGLIKIIP
ncbi:MAG: carbohydrate binding domain-containing protein [Patescibacteria group bacterium]|nr:carbohydrate binding domain-containing protein [Patescibacteria group bacterium]